MRDIWDTAKRIWVGMNKAKKKAGDNQPLKSNQILSVQPILHLNTYITFHNASHQVSCALLSSFV